VAVACRPLRLACAWALAALITLPFTAPFSTCDAGMLFADVHSAAAHPVEPVFSSPSLDIMRSDDAAPGSLLDEEPFKDVTVSTVTLLSPPTVDAPAGHAVVAASSVSRPSLVALRL
jgi:hypothetical protein